MGIDIQKLQAAISDMPAVNLKGKKYTMVAQRIEAFRKIVGTDLGMNMDVLVDDGSRVVIKATISDKDGFVVATGLAEELRGGSGVNRTACIENTETSAVGRALANLGLHGGEYASIEEIEKAERNDAKLDTTPPPAKDVPFDERDAWQQWIAAQKLEIDKATSLNQCTGWAHRTADERARCEAFDAQLYRQLADYFNAKYDTFNTGEE